MEGIPQPRVREEEPDDAQNLARAFVESGAQVVEEGEERLSAMNLLPFKELSPQTIAAMQNLADSARDYLALPLVTDRFEDHAARRKWRDALVVDLGLSTAQYFRDNRLSLKKMTPLVLRASTALSRLKNETDPAAAEARERVEAILEPLLPVQNFAFTYMELADEDKVRLIQDLSGRVRSYLELVTGFGSGEERQAA